MYRENANKPVAGIEGRERCWEKQERSEKQREKVKDVRAKQEKRKSEKEFFKKARPGVEREMKMNERCKGRIECEHSSVLSFRGVSESFLLRCSAFVIKFNPRLSQLQPIDSLSLSPSVSLLFFSPSLSFLSLPLPLQLSFASGTLFLVLLWNVICGEVWGCKEQLCVCVCKCVCTCMCLWLKTAYMNVLAYVYIRMCLSSKSERGHLWNMYFLLFYQKYSWNITPVKTLSFWCNSRKIQYLKKCRWLLERMMPEKEIRSQTLSTLGKCEMGNVGFGASGLSEVDSAQMLTYPWLQQ